MKHRFFTTDITARLACVLFLAFMGTAALTASSTVPARMAAIEGDWAVGFFVLILLMAFAILIDIVINSMMPDEYQWEWVKSRRDLLYLLSGFMSMAPSFYISKLFGMTSAGAILYIGMPILIFHLALCDIKAKYYGDSVHEAV